MAPKKQNPNYNINWEGDLPEEFLEQIDLFNRAYDKGKGGRYIEMQPGEDEMGVPFTLLTWRVPQTGSDVPKPNAQMRAYHDEDTGQVGVMRQGSSRLFFFAKAMDFTGTTEDNMKVSGFRDEVQNFRSMLESPYAFFNAPEAGTSRGLWSTEIGKLHQDILSSRQGMTVAPRVGSYVYKNKKTGTEELRTASLHQEHYEEMAGFLSSKLGGTYGPRENFMFNEFARFDTDAVGGISINLSEKDKQRLFHAERNERLDSSFTRTEPVYGGSHFKDRPALFGHPRDFIFSSAMILPEGSAASWEEGFLGVSSRVSLPGSEALSEVDMFKMGIGPNLLYGKEQPRYMPESWTFFQGTNIGGFDLENAPFGLVTGVTPGGGLGSGINATFDVLRLQPEQTREIKPYPGLKAVSMGMELTQEQRQTLSSALPGFPIRNLATLPRKKGRMQDLATKAFMSQPAETQMFAFTNIASQAGFGQPEIDMMARLEANQLSLSNYAYPLFNEVARQWFAQQGKQVEWPMSLSGQMLGLMKAQDENKFNSLFGSQLPEGAQLGGEDLFQLKMPTTLYGVSLVGFDQPLSSTGYGNINPHVVNVLGRRDPSLLSELMERQQRGEFYDPSANILKAAAVTAGIGSAMSQPIDGDFFVALYQDTVVRYGGEIGLPIFMEKLSEKTGNNFLTLSRGDTTVTLPPGRSMSAMAEHMRYDPESSMEDASFMQGVYATLNMVFEGRLSEVDLKQLAEQVSVSATSGTAGQRGRGIYAKGLSGVALGNPLLPHGVGTAAADDLHKLISSMGIEPWEKKQMHDAVKQGKAVQGMVFLSEANEEAAAQRLTFYSYDAVDRVYPGASAYTAPEGSFMIGPTMAMEQKKDFDADRNFAILMRPRSRERRFKLDLTMGTAGNEFEPYFNKVLDPTLPDRLLNEPYGSYSKGLYRGVGSYQGDLMERAYHKTRMQNAWWAVENLGTFGALAGQNYGFDPTHDISNFASQGYQRAMDATSIMSRANLQMENFHHGYALANPRWEGKSGLKGDRDTPFIKSNDYASYSLQVIDMMLRLNWEEDQHEYLGDNSSIGTVHWQARLMQPMGAYNDKITANKVEGRLRFSFQHKPMDEDMGYSPDPMIGYLAAVSGNRWTPSEVEGFESLYAKQGNLTSYRYGTNRIMDAALQTGVGMGGQEYMSVLSSYLLGKFANNTRSQWHAEPWYWPKTSVSQSADMVFEANQGVSYRKRSPVDIFANIANSEGQATAGQRWLASRYTQDEQAEHTSIIPHSGNAAMVPYRSPERGLTVYGRGYAEGGYADWIGQYIDHVPNWENLFFRKSDTFSYNREDGVGVVYYPENYEKEFNSGDARQKRVRRISAQGVLGVPREQVEASDWAKATLAHEIGHHINLGNISNEGWNRVIAHYGAEEAKAQGAEDPDVAYQNIPVERDAWTNAAVLARKSGQYTGHGGKYQPAGVVHAGEYVLSQEDVAAITAGDGHKILAKVEGDLKVIKGDMGQYWTGGLVTGTSRNLPGHADPPGWVSPTPGAPWNGTEEDWIAYNEEVRRQKFPSNRTTDAQDQLKDMGDTPFREPNRGFEAMGTRRDRQNAGAGNDTPVPSRHGMPEGFGTVFATLSSTGETSITSQVPDDPGLIDDWLATHIGRITQGKTAGAAANLEDPDLTGYLEAAVERLTTYNTMTAEERVLAGTEHRASSDRLLGTLQAVINNANQVYAGQESGQIPSWVRDMLRPVSEAVQVAAGQGRKGTSPAQAEAEDMAWLEGLRTENQQARVELQQYAVDFDREQRKSGLTDAQTLSEDRAAANERLRVGRYETQAEVDASINSREDIRRRDRQTVGAGNRELDEERAQANQQGFDAADSRRNDAYRAADDREAAAAENRRAGRIAGRAVDAETKLDEDIQRAVGPEYHAGIPARAQRNTLIGRLNDVDVNTLMDDIKTVAEFDPEQPQTPANMRRAAGAAARVQGVQNQVNRLNQVDPTALYDAVNADVVNAVPAMTEVLASAGGVRAGQLANATDVHTGQQAANFGAMDQFVGKLDQMGKVLDRVTAGQDTYIAQADRIVKLYDAQVATLQAADNAINELGGDTPANRQILGATSPNTLKILEAADNGLRQGLADSRTTVDALRQGVASRAVSDLFGSYSNEAERRSVLQGTLLSRSAGANLARTELDDSYFRNEQGDISLGLGGPVGAAMDQVFNTRGRIEGLAGAARWTEGFGRMLYGASHLKWNILEPMEHEISAYYQQEQVYGQGMMQSGAVSPEQMMTMPYGDAMRRQGKIANYQFAQNQAMAMAYGGIAGTPAMGRAAGAFQAVTNPAFGASFMAQTMLPGAMGDFIAPIAGAAVLGAAALNYVGETAASSSSTVARAQDYTSFLMNPTQNLGTGVGILADPLGNAGALVRSVFNPNGFREDARMGVVRSDLDAYMMAPKGTQGRALQTLNTSTSNYMIHGDQGVLNAETYTQFQQSAQAGWGLSPELSGNLYAWNRMYAPTTDTLGFDINNPMFQEMRGLGQKDIDIAGMSSRALAASGFMPSNRQMMTQMATQLTNRISGAPLEEQSLIAADIEDNAQRLAQLNQTRTAYGMQALDTTLYQNPYADNPMKAGLFERSLQIEVGQQAYSSQYRNFRGGAGFLGQVQGLINTGHMDQAATMMNAEPLVQELDMRMQMYGTGTSQSRAQLVAGIRGLDADTLNLTREAYGGNRMAQQELFYKRQGNRLFKTIDMQTGADTFEYGVDNDDYANMSDFAALNGMSNWMPTQAQVAGGRAGARKELYESGRIQAWEQFRVEDFGRRGEYQLTTGGAQGVDAQGFANGGDGLKALVQLIQGMGKTFNPGNGMGLWQVQDASTMLGRQQQDWSMQMQGANLALNRQSFNLQGQQYQENYDLRMQQFAYGTQYQRQEMTIGQSHQMTQLGWQKEDLEFGRAQMDLHFGWQMEDYSRNIRYARGREKRDLMREQQRATVEYGMQSGQADKQEDRLAQRTKWEEEQFNRQKNYFEQTTQFQKQQMELEKRHFDQGRVLENQRMQMSEQDHQKQIVWLNQERQLEDQQRLLQRQWWDVQNQVNQDFATKMFGLSERSRDLTTWLDLMDQAMVGVTNKARIFIDTVGAAGTNTGNVGSGGSGGGGNGSGTPPAGGGGGGGGGGWTMPANPSVGQIWQDPTGKKWRFNGQSWAPYTGSGGAGGGTVNPTPPSGGGGGGGTIGAFSAQTTSRSVGVSDTGNHEVVQRLDTIITRLEEGNAKPTTFKAVIESKSGIIPLTEAARAKM